MANYHSDRSEYHQGDAPFQFPWWAIVGGFVAWTPLGIGFLIYNLLAQNGLVDLNRFLKSGGKAPTAGAGPAYVRDAQQAAARRAASEPYETPYQPSPSGGDAPGPVYAKPTGPQPAPARKADKKRRKKSADGGETALLITGIVLVVLGVLVLPESLTWLSDALAEGGVYWSWLGEDLIGALMMLGGGIGCLYGSGRLKTNRRMRKKITNIVGDAPYRYIEDIAASIPCSYDKCCRYLEDCIDRGVFGEGAYLDMRTRCLVIKAQPPQSAPAPAPAAAEPPAETPKAAQNRYQSILDELRRVNDAIPDETMSDKISRLETVSARIFDQARTNPDKLPQMRKFMDYYLPTALKLLKTYAELDAQGIEGENITESKRRIEQAMDTMTRAFEAQLDQLFQSDALDVSTDIDVMEHMLRADGLSADPLDSPFHLS